MRFRSSKMKAHFLFLTLLVLIFSCRQQTKPLNEIAPPIAATIPSADIERIQLYADSAFQFCQQRNYSKNFCFLLDMSLHSGIERFFVWDFEQEAIVNSMLVAHGCCDKNWGVDESKAEPIFSNVPNSHCSSLGKYKIGERGYSQWGINVKYLMHGLEKNNSNALSRYIVLHSWVMMSDTSTYPIGSPEGWGCPAVSNENMKVLDNLLKSSEKPVLMWMFE